MAEYNFKILSSSTVRFMCPVHLRHVLTRNLASRQREDLTISPQYIWIRNSRRAFGSWNSLSIKIYRFSLETFLSFYPLPTNKWYWRSLQSILTTKLAHLATLLVKFQIKQQNQSRSVKKVNELFLWRIAIKLNVYNFLQHKNHRFYVVVFGTVYKVVLSRT